MSVALKPQRTSKTASNSWNEGSQSLFFHRQIDDEVQQKDRRKNHEKDLPNAIHSPAKWYELLCHPRAGVAKPNVLRADQSAVLLQSLPSTDALPLLSCMGAGMALGGLISARWWNRRDK